MKRSACALVFAFTFLVPPAFASSDASWTQLDKASAKTCIATSGLLKAKVSAPVRFSDATGYDMRIVTGVYPQKHMKGAKGQMVCLYSRKAKKAEVQEMVK